MNNNSKIRLISGNYMPVLGIGTWQMMTDTADTIAYAIRAGFRLIDTSSDYQTQPGIAEGLRRSRLSRENVYLVSKVEEYDDSYERTILNLKELGVEYLDLTLIHRPPEDSAGEELWKGLIKARNDGLTKDIGVSNYSQELIDALIAKTNEAPAVNQIEWSPYGFSYEMRDYCRTKNIVLQAYSPLTRGRKLNTKVLRYVADLHKRSPAQILIRWNLQNGSVPIPKANQIKHIDENIDVFDFELSGRDMRLLNSLNEHYSSLGGLPFL